MFGNARTYKYDVVGNTRKMTDRLGRVTTYNYDNLYRLNSESWDDTAGTVFNYTYDLVGNLLTASDINSAAYTFTYDDLDRVGSETQTITGLNSSVVLNANYDLAGSRTQLSATIGSTADFVTSYSYDDLYRMTSVTQQGNEGNGVAAKHVAFAYDIASQMTDVNRYASSTAVGQLVAHSLYGYDKTGRVTDITHTNSISSAIADYDFVYDKANRLTRFDSHGAIDDFFADYTYDDRNQLIGADYTGTVAGLATALQDENYGYDDNGNRLNANGTSRSPDGTDNRLQTNGTHRFAYNAEGNRTAKFIDNGDGVFGSGDTDITEYTWDHRNRLTQITQRANYADVIDTLMIDYEYDVFDRRVSKTVDPDGDGTQMAYRDFYVYDGQHIALEFHDSDADGFFSVAVLSHRYLHGPRIDMILADEQIVSGSGPGEVYWALPDHLGSTRDVVDSAGNIVTHFVYNTFGQITGETNPNFYFRFTFTGRERDAETPDLMYYRARYYSTTEGLFISNDPIGFDGGDLNLSRYVKNQVTTRTDPSGLRDPDEVFGSPEYVYPPSPRSVGTINVVPVDLNESNKLDSTAPAPILLSRMWCYGTLNSPLTPSNADQMVDLIKKRAGKNGKIDRLVIRTHGSSASINVGMEELPSGQIRTNHISLALIDPRNQHHNQHLVNKLRELRPYFTSNSKVTLWSCNTRKGEKGERFMQLLANILGVDVEGIDVYTDEAIFPGLRNDDVYSEFWTIFSESPWRSYPPYPNDAVK